jgi:hypothetical protein
VVREAAEGRLFALAVVLHARYPRLFWTISRVNPIMGLMILDEMDKGAKLGMVIERRFRKGMERKRDEGLFPEWLGFVVAAEQSEDRRGTDMWAYTDVGKIPLQIKASQSGKERHVQRYNRYHIACIVVPLNKPFDEVFAEAIEIISRERDKIVERNAKIAQARRPGSLN